MTKETLDFRDIHMLSLEILEGFMHRQPPITSTDAIFACALAMGRFMRMGQPQPKLRVEEEVAFIEMITEFGGTWMQTAGVIPS